MLRPLSDAMRTLRLFRGTPGLTAVALLSIAITVGATAVVFTAVKTVLIEPLPYAHADELVQIGTGYARTGPSHADWAFWPDMQDVRKSTRTLESLGIYRYALFNLSGDGNAPPEALYGAAVSVELFPMLGVKPMLGRNILPGEDQPGRDREMILSYGLWVRRFNSDRNVVGRSVEVNGHPCTIIGVMPAEFDFPMRLATTVRVPSQHMDFWTPAAADPAKATRTTPAFGAVARLHKGATIQQAREDLASIGARLARQYPVTNQDRCLYLTPLRDRTLGFARTGLLLLMAAAVMFLLIGCANVANLVLARSLARHREISIRLALGATRARIVRQLVMESGMLGVVGGAIGYGFAVAAWRLLPAVAPMSIPRLATARPDWTVLAFTLAVSIFNGVLFGIAPAIRSSRLKPGTRGAIGASSTWLRSALVIGEVAVAVTLVIVGGLLTVSFVRLLRTDPGFDAGRVLASIIIPSGDQYQTPGSHEVLYRRILENVRLLPGVQSAGTVDALPFTGENNGGKVSVGETELQAEIDRVSAEYLPTMGVRLLDGRGFRDDDMHAGRDTAIVDDVLANRLWPHQSAIGKRICLFCDSRTQDWKQIVGVVTTVRHSGLDEPLGNNVYYAAGALEHAQFLVLRTDRPSSELAQAVRRAVAAADPKQPVFLSASMSRLIGDTIADRRFIMTLLAVTGVLALLLAAAGIYGVVSYTTSQRTQEIGVRMALGATPGRVRSMIVSQGMRATSAGLAIGLAMALPATRLLHNALDPVLIAAGAALVILTAAAACLLPAIRATKVDPMQSLREETR